MIIQIKMPDLATNDSEIKVLRWLVEVGQPIKQGQAILEVETDKATTEVESYASGILRETLVKPEEKVETGHAIARVEIP